MADVKLKTVANFRGHVYVIPMGTPESKIKQMVFDHFSALFPEVDMKTETVQMTSYYAKSCGRGYCYYNDK